MFGLVTSPKLRFGNVTWFFYSYKSSRSRYFSLPLSLVIIIKNGVEAVAVLLQLHQWTFVTFPRINCRNHHYNNNSAHKFFTLISPCKDFRSQNSLLYSAELTISFFCSFLFLGLNFWFQDLVQVRVLWGIVFISLFIFIVNSSKELCDSVNWFHSVWFPLEKKFRVAYWKPHTQMKKISLSKIIGSRLNWIDLIIGF